MQLETGRHSKSKIHRGGQEKQVNTLVNKLKHKDAEEDKGRHCETKADKDRGRHSKDRGTKVDTGGGQGDNGRHSAAEL